MKQSSVFAAIAVLVLVFSPVAVAQTITGNIIGTVSDETGAVLPGVEITVRNQDTGISRSVVSNDDGTYRAQSLAVGPYEVRAELAGFQTLIRTGIGLTVGQQAVVNLTLQIGSISEQVIVTGEASLVETTQSTVSEIVSEKTISDLPLNGRNFIQLALLQSGVINSVSAPRSQAGNEGIKISIAGTRTTQTAVLLDGTDIRGNQGTTPGGPGGGLLGVETVKEFQVITGVFSAEYGRFTGGVINTVSKSGTNQIHGSVFEYHRNSALDARNFFDRNPENPLERSSPPAFKRNQFGFSLGGPIIQDKTFFFGSYEGLRERLAATTISNVPNALARQGMLPIGPGGSLVDVGVDPSVQPYLDLFPAGNGADNGDGTQEFIFAANSPIDEDYYMFKIDHQLSDNDSVFGRYTLNDGESLITQPFPQFFRTPVYRNQYLTLEWKRIVSPSMINTFRAGFNRTVHNVIPVADPVPDRSLYFSPFDFAVFGEMGIGGSTSILGLSHNQNSRTHYNSFQFSDDLIYTRGRHSLKFGVNIDRINLNYVSFSRASGVYDFDNLEDFLTSEPAQFDVFVEKTGMIGVRTTLIGMFIQDDFTFTPNLTINMGLRYEFITVPTEVGGRLANLDHPLDPALFQGDPYFENPSLKNFSPRIGFAWSPFGNGKSSVRGGFGVFFDQIMTPYYSSPIAQSLPNIRATENFAPGEGNFPNDFDTLPPSDSVQQGPWVIFNPDQPYVMQWSFNIQNEVFPGAVALIGYSGHRANHLGRFVNANAAITTRDTTGPRAGQWFFPPDAEARNPAFGELRATVWDARSFYHALRLSFQKRFSQRYQFQFSYNFSKNIDDGSGTNFSDRGGGSDNIWTTFIDDVSLDRGLSGNNIFHTFSANFTWELPGDNLSGAAGAIFGNWQVGGIVTATSGEMMTVDMSGDRARLRTGRLTPNRPDRIPGVELVIGDAPDNYLNPDAYTVQPAGYIGDLARGSIEGPGRFLTDLSLIKNIPFGSWESTRLSFRAEFFNIFNRANFSVPGSRWATGDFDNPNGPRLSGTFGKSTSTVDTSRQIQFALRISF